MGRRTRLKPHTHKTLCDAIRIGAPYSKAAAAAGIHEATLYRWLALGREGKALYRELCEDIEKAEAMACIEALSVIRKAGIGIPAVDPIVDEEGKVVVEGRAAVIGQWTAAAWYLERKYPDQFGRRARLDVETRGEITHREEAPRGLDTALHDLRERLLSMKDRIQQAEQFKDA